MKAHNNNSDIFVLRPVVFADLKYLMAITKAVGAGMTSIPRSKEDWELRISESNRSFQSAEDSADPNTFFMVLEHVPTGEVVGTTAVYSGIGTQEPFYSFRLEKVKQNNTNLSFLKKSIKTLKVVQSYADVIEVGSLYLKPDYRRDPISKILTKSRYLFIKQNRKRFKSDVIIAEIRGWQDKKGRSPFWEMIGKKLFGIEWEVADHFNCVEGGHLLASAMPKIPIYEDLLPSEAKMLFGKPHCDSIAAYQMLLNEGFSYTGYFDIFDGGPTLEAQVHNVDAIKNSVRYTAKVSDRVPEKAVSSKYIICNDSFERFRSTAADICIQDGHAVVNHLVANSLNIENGDPVRLTRMISRNSLGILDRIDQDVSFTKRAVVKNKSPSAPCAIGTESLMQVASDDR